MADDKKQSDKFEDVARRLGADESGGKFERAFKKIAPPKKAKTSKDRQSSEQGSKAKP